MTSVSVSYGNETLQTYFSYANTTGKGIRDKNELKKHNINLRETATMFNKRLKLDGNVNVMKQTVENKPVSGGFYMNPLVGLYRFPRGENLSYYKDHFETYDEERNLNVQNWHTFTEDFEQNPYWIVNRIQSKETRTRIILSLSANFKINDWLTIQARGNMDYWADKLRQKFYASTATALCGANGRYIEMDYRQKLKDEGKLNYFAGKVELISKGAFDDVDMCMMVHNFPLTEEGYKLATRNTGNGFIGKNTHFLGKQSHAGAAPWDGINALNMASLAMTAMAYHRETFRGRGYRAGSSDYQ